MGKASPGAPHRGSPLLLSHPLTQGKVLRRNLDNQRSSQVSHERQGGC